MSVRAFLNRHTTSDCCWEQTWIDLWWWRWWTSDDVTIFYLITVRLHVSMCNRRMHYLIRRVSNKLLPLFSLDGSPWSTDQGRTRHLYRYVFVASHAIVSYYFSRSLSLSLSRCISIVQTPLNMRNSTSAIALFTDITKACKKNECFILYRVS
jgi:hypothetical protein